MASAFALDTDGNTVMMSKILGACVTAALVGASPTMGLAQGKVVEKSGAAAGGVVGSTVGTAAGGPVVGAVGGVVGSTVGKTTGKVVNAVVPGGGKKKKQRKAQARAQAEAQAEAAGATQQTPAGAVPQDVGEIQPSGPPTGQ